MKTSVTMMSLAAMGLGSSILFTGRKKMTANPKSWETTFHWSAVGEYPIGHTGGSVYG